ncbi:hypothetical protein NDAWWUGD_CDS0139 [Salmonella phage SeKF_80]
MTPNKPSRKRACAEHLAEQAFQHVFLSLRLHRLDCYSEQFAVNLAFEASTFGSAEGVGRRVQTQVGFEWGFKIFQVFFGRFTLFGDFHQFAVVVIAVGFAHRADEGRHVFPVIEFEPDIEQVAAFVYSNQVNHNVSVVNFQLFITPGNFGGAAVHTGRFTQRHVHVQNQVNEVGVRVTVELFNHRLQHVKGHVSADAPEHADFRQEVFVDQHVVTVANQNFFFQLNVTPVVEETAWARQQEFADLTIVGRCQEQFVVNASTVQQGQEAVLFVVVVVFLLELVDEYDNRLGNGVHELVELSTHVRFFNQKNRFVFFKRQGADGTGQQGFARAFITRQQYAGVLVRAAVEGVQHFTSTRLNSTVQLFRQSHVSLTTQEETASHRVVINHIDAGWDSRNLITTVRRSEYILATGYKMLLFHVTSSFVCITVKVNKPSHEKA